jgi:ribosomal protein S18 acetylase RimI-like enzyme
VQDALPLTRLNYALHQLHAEAQPERYKTLQPEQPEVIAFYQGQLADPQVHIWIAEQHQTPIGYLSMIFREIAENPFVISQPEWVIDQLGIEPAYQRQGIGRQLLAVALETAGMTRVTLSVAAFNHQAIAFYERYGFVTYSLRMTYDPHIKG